MFVVVVVVVVTAAVSNEAVTALLVDTGLVVRRAVVDWVVRVVGTNFDVVDDETASVAQGKQYL
jgi:hypothetical protein